ncbi:MAG: deoxyribose-phosphate aldolase, partial [Gemmatimonadota bacterium]|nr:deoxyribose-phosphate aldolase [Gemmatimonadota bacterium]
MVKSLDSIAKMIDHSLLHPALTDQELVAGCGLALAYNVASVSIKPYAVALAVDILGGSGVEVGTVVGFPQGNSHIGIKVAEARQGCAEGATELDAVLNIGKVLSRDWDYIDREIKALSKVAREKKALLKLIFENGYLTDDTLKVKLCELCSRHSVDFVKTSTGYCFMKQEDGTYAAKGATDHDLELMRSSSLPSVQVK